MNSVLKKGRVPQKLHVDQGKEFYNSEFKALMRRYDITLYSTFSNLKVSWMKPKDVTTRNETSLLRSVYGRPRVNRTRKIKFKVGEKVRISKNKHIFEKGYTPNWTTEIFTISEVKNTDPVTYKLVDYQDHPIEGGFYQEDLTKVKYPDAYLVEKIVRKRGNKVFVK